MRKTFLKLGLTLGAVLAFTNCTKELESPVAPEGMKGEEFELCAMAPATKTVNDGLNTNWKLNDKLAVFYGAAGTETFSAGLVYNCDVAETGHFKGNLDAKLPLAESNDWYAFYSSAINSKGELQAAFKTPKKSSWLTFGGRVDYATPQVQKQKGLNSTAHIDGINYPLYGEVKGVAAGQKPEIQMAHLSALIRVDIQNSSDTDLNVSDIEIETPAGKEIMGLFTYEVGANVPLLTPVKGKAKTIARLEVSDAVIAAGAKASFYIGTVPFGLKAGESLKVRVNDYEKVLTFNKPVEFMAGKIKVLPAFPYAAKAPEMKAGKYVIAAKDDNGDFYALKNTAISKRLDQLNIGKVDPKTSYISIDRGLLWDVEVTNGGFLIKDQAGKYLSWNLTDKGNSATVTADQFVLSAMGDPRGFFQLQFDEPAPSTVVRVLAWNKDAKGFAFYDASKTTMKTELYLINATASEKQFLAEPQVTVEGTAAKAVADNKIVVTWTDVANAGSYLVSCSGQTAQTVKQGVQTATFTGMDYGTYEVKVKALPADANKFVEKESAVKAVELMDPNVLIEVGDYVEITKAADFTDGGQYLFYGENAPHKEPGLMHNTIVDNNTIKKLRPVNIEMAGSKNLIKAASVANLLNEVVWTYNATEKTISSVALKGTTEEVRYLRYDGKKSTSVQVLVGKSSNAAENQWIVSQNTDLGIVLTSANTKNKVRSLCVNMGGSGPNTVVAIGAYNPSTKYRPVRIFKKKVN